MPVEKWEFSHTLPNAVERLSYLTTPPSFERIVDLIANEMKMLCCHPEPCKGQAGFDRPVYCIQVSEKLFDLFFNSVSGYRGSYFRSEFAGLGANKHFIKTLLPRFLEFGLPFEKEFTTQS